jgi:hypothetical protein
MDLFMYIVLRSKYCKTIPTCNSIFHVYTLTSIQKKSKSHFFNANTLCNTLMCKAEFMPLEMLVYKQLTP